MRIALIVAMAENRVIGKAQGLPWRLSGDLQYFKTITLGKPIVMGRKTYESIGYPLPGRTNIIVSRDPHYEADGCLTVTSLDQALAAASGVLEIMIIGGSELYQHSMKKADRIYLTEVHAEVPGDTFFQELDHTQWTEVSRQRNRKDEKNDYDYSFVVLDRNAKRRH